MREARLLGSGRRLFSAAAHAPLDLAAPPSVILLGGLGMKPRALEKTATALYPSLSVQSYTHSLNELVNVSFCFAANQARLVRALKDAGPGGAIVHVFSGAAFYSLMAMRDWGAAAVASGAVSAHPSARIRGVVLDSIPYKRVESKLLEAANVPAALAPAVGALAARLLVSPLFGATVALTDAYERLQRAPSTFAFTGGRRVLVAHSVDDAIVPVSEFRSYVGDLHPATGWRPAGHAASDALAAYLTGIQATSAVHPRYDGAWLRAFDFSWWEYWGAAADRGWGPWAMETGWGTTWISAALALRQRNTSYWDVARAGTGVDAALLARWCPVFLGSEAPALCASHTFEA